MITFTPDEAFVIGIALDDWLAQNPPGDDDDARARYEQTAQLRDRLNGS